MNKLLLLLLVACFWNCSDNSDSQIFVDLPTDALSFKPIAGGAVMYYILPDDPDIVGIQVRYTGVDGRQILCAGSCTCDSVLLVGFNEAMNNVPAQVSISYVGDKESQPINVTFSTEDSAPVAFLKNVQIASNWDGFVLSFDNPANATGMAHVFYIGIDPISELQDTILVESFLLTETIGTKNVTYTLAQEIAAPTVIIRAEDFRGYMVGEKVWENVPTLTRAKLSPSNFTFYCDNSIESDYDKLGAKYLFDGDLKGEIAWGTTDHRCYSFLAGPDAAGEKAHPMYMDMGENKIVASLRLYDMFDHDDGPVWTTGGYYEYAGIVYQERINELPCEVTLYGLKDDGGTPDSYEDMATLEGWEEIGSFKQDKTLCEDPSRWCAESCRTWKAPLSEEEILAADPSFLEVVVPALGQGEGYRYLKMVINEVFDFVSDTRNYLNNYKYVQFHELEIYTNKE